MSRIVTLTQLALRRQCRTIKSSSPDKVQDLVSKKKEERKESFLVSDLSKI
jgi:hypothetical protein